MSDINKASVSLDSIKTPKEPAMEINFTLEVNNIEMLPAIEKTINLLKENQLYYTLKRINVHERW